MDHRREQGAEIGGTALLLFGGAVAFAVIRASRQGPYGAWVSYSTAVLWALVAVIVEQWATSMVTTVAAVATAILVLVAVLGPWGKPSRPFSRPAPATGN